jgi:hypothetical protein
MLRHPLILLTIIGFSLVPLSAETPSIPLAQLSVEAFKQSTEAALKAGDFGAWTEYLGKQLAAETGRATFSATPEQIKKIADHPVLSLALAQWRLLTSCGPENVKTMATAEGVPFLAWLLSNREALHAYLGSGPLDKESTAHGLEIWRDIFKADPQSREGLWLRVAAAVALAHTVPVKCIADGSEIDPVRRYQYFKNAQSSGLLFDSFSKAATWELRFVVNSWSRDEELAWVVNAVDAKNKTQEKIGEACWMVPYRLTNSKGVSVQNGPEYYEHKPVTLELMHTVGGVCGAISRFGTSAAQAFGVPAMPVGQPGHCAFLWKKDPQSWRTGNDISGWAGSTEHGGIYIHWGNRGSYVLLMEQAHREPLRFLASEQARWLAAATAEPAKATALLETAAKIQPLNGGVWLDLLEAHTKAKAATAAWQNLAAAMLRALPDHPIPLAEFLARAEAHLNLADDEARKRYVASVCAAIAGGSAEAQHGCGQAAQTELVLRQARSIAPKAGKVLEAYLEGSEEPAKGEPLTDTQRNSIQGLVEAAVNASAKRSDLENALTGRYLGLMSSNPVALARALKFFGALFEQAKANPDRKPAIALARRLILLAAKAEDLTVMEKYSTECQRLLSAK